jgi:hypothetical protein
MGLPLFQYSIIPVFRYLSVPVFRQWRFHCSSFPLFHHSKIPVFLVSFCLLTTDYCLPSGVILHFLLHRGLLGLIMRDISGDYDWILNGERRSGIDRRQFTYSSHIPERRSGKDRRSGLDRRSAAERRKSEGQGNKPLERRSGIDRRKSLDETPDE